MLEAPVVVLMPSAALFVCGNTVIVIVAESRPFLLVQVISAVPSCHAEIVPFSLTLTTLLSLLFQIYFAEEETSETAVSVSVSPAFSVVFSAEMESDSEKEKQK
mgnify:FL=1